MGWTILTRVESKRVLGSLTTIKEGSWKSNGRWDFLHSPWQQAVRCSLLHISAWKHNLEKLPFPESHHNGSTLRSGKVAVSTKQLARKQASCIVLAPVPTFNGTSMVSILKIIMFYWQRATFALTKSLFKCKVLFCFVFFFWWWWFWGLNSGPHSVFFFFFKHPSLMLGIRLNTHSQ
jgi:hypothetical protein